MLRKLAVFCLVSAAAADVLAQSVIVPRAILESYVGAYRTASGDVTRIMLQRGLLVGEDGAGRRTRFVAQSENVFLAESGEVRMEFVKGGAGTVTRLLLTGPSPSEEAIRVQVARDILERYIGTYTISSDLSMAITFEGDRLIAQITGQSKVPVFAESATKFFVQDFSSGDVAELEFGTEQGGPVYVVLRQNGYEQKVTRN